MVEAYFPACSRKGRRKEERERKNEERKRTRQFDDFILDQNQRTSDSR